MKFVFEKASLFYLINLTSISEDDQLEIDCNLALALSEIESSIELNENMYYICYYLMIFIILKDLQKLNECWIAKISNVIIIQTILF